LDKLKPRKTLPSFFEQRGNTLVTWLGAAYHYGTFDLPPGSYGGCDPDDSLPHIQDQAARFLILNPGELLKLPLDPLE
jgi:hypothetical protein